MAPLPFRVMLAALELVHHIPTALIPATVGDQLGHREIINVNDPIESPLIHDTTSLSPTFTFITTASPSPTDTVEVTFERIQARAEPDSDDTSSTTTTKHSSSTRTRSRTRTTTTVTVTRSVFSWTSNTAQPSQFLSSSTSEGTLTDSSSSSIPTPLPAVSTTSTTSTLRNLFQDADWNPPEPQAVTNTRAQAAIGASVGGIVLILLGLLWGMKVKSSRRRMIKYGVALPSGAEKPQGWNGKLRNVWRVRRMKKAEDQKLKDEMSTRYGNHGAASSTTLTALNGF